MNQTMKIASQANPRWWLTLAGLAVLIALGAYLRLFDLGRQTLSHVEMYVPGIPLPAGISVPAERLTLWRVWSDTISADTHPVGYYALMWIWTKCFGTAVWALCLPAALLGIASIPLVFWLGALSGQRTAGWIAAALIAANGHHVFWSQIARMFSLTCFVGLLATILLLLIAKGDPAPRWSKALYILSLLAGVACHIFFWTIILSHCAWTFFSASHRKQPFPGAAKLQVLALILGSPFLAFAAYQAQNGLAVLSRNMLVYGRELVLFAFLVPLEGYSSGVYRKVAHMTYAVPPVSPAHWIFFSFSLLLLTLGIASIQEAQPGLLSDTRGASLRAWLLSAAVSTLVILLFLYWIRSHLTRSTPALGAAEAMVLFPFAIAGGGLLLERSWTWLADLFSRIPKNRFFSSEQGLVAMMFVVPFAALTLISLKKPIFNARGMLLLTPYVLLVLSRGIERLGRRPILAAAFLVLVGVADYSGLREYRQMTAGRADFKAFAAALNPRVMKGDLIFFQPSWYATPILYYMRSWDQFVGRHYTETARQKAHARVWVLWFYNYEEKVPKDMQDPLSNYQTLETVEAPGAQAVLYSPKTLETPISQ